MRPTLEDGNLVIVDRWQVPHNGDIVVANSNEMGGSIIKRIVAEGGSAVAMEKGRLIRDRESIYEDYLSQENIDQKETWGEQEVPLGMYFLMGDNREHSVDSRCFGSIAKEAIKGTVVFTLFQ